MLYVVYSRYKLNAQQYFSRHVQFYQIGQLPRLMPHSVQKKKLSPVQKLVEGVIGASLITQIDSRMSLRISLANARPNGKW